MRTFEIIGDESMKELAKGVSNQKTFDDKYAVCLTILMYLQVQNGGSYTMEISHIQERDLLEERENATYGDGGNALLPGLYPPLCHFLFYLNRNDKDVYDYLKKTCKRIEDEKRKKQTLKTYGFFAFIIIAIVILSNL